MNDAEGAVRTLRIQARVALAERSNPDTFDELLACTQIKNVNVSLRRTI